MTKVADVSIKMVASTDDALNTIERFAARAKAVFMGGMDSNKVMARTIGDAQALMRGTFIGLGAATALGVKAISEYAKESEHAARQLSEIEATWKRILADTGEDIFNIGGANAGDRTSGLMKKIDAARDFAASAYAAEFKILEVVARGSWNVQSALLNNGFSAMKGEMANAWQDVKAVSWGGAESPFTLKSAKDDRRRLAERQRLRAELEETKRMTLLANDETAKAIFDAEEWGRKQKAQVNKEIKAENGNPEAQKERSRVFAAIDVEVARRRASALDAAEQKRRDAARKAGEEQERAWEQHQDLLEQLQKERDEKADFLQLLEQEAKVAAMIAAGNEKGAKQAALDFERQKELTKLRSMDLTYLERTAAIANVNARFESDLAALNKPERQEQGSTQAYGYSSGPRGLAGRVFAQPGTSTVAMDESRKQTRILEQIRDKLNTSTVPRFGP